MNDTITQPVAPVAFSQTDAQLVESYAGSTARKSEKPFFQSKFYSRNVFGNTYRINFYNTENETIRSVMVKVIDGTIKVNEIQ